MVHDRFNLEQLRQIEKHLRALPKKIVTCITVDLSNSALNRFYKTFNKRMTPQKGVRPH